jgi:hypothetical protein
MSDASLLLFVPTLFALVCLFTRRNIFCMYLAVMVWLQSVIVTASHRKMFGLLERERITFVCLFVAVLSFAAVLSFLLRKRGKGQ